MKESLLHYLWQYQLFYRPKLRTTKGEFIEVKAIGEHNTNSGPDFLNVQLKIGRQLWAGNLEIHVKSSDWFQHHHEKDSGYDNVILHVVWEHDIDVFNSMNQEIAVLELKNYVSKQLLSSYKQLFSKSKQWINCEKGINRVDEFVWEHWLERLYFERLEEKSKFVKSCLEQTNFDWEAVLFQLLTRNFGLRINASVFFEMAKQLDFSIVRKESRSVTHLESLFFGQFGLLQNSEENRYHQKLKLEYNYQCIKYNLSSSSFGQVQFFRLRPMNFPTIRISQLANLYAGSQQLFSKAMELTGLSEAYDLFSVSTSSFWETHYTFAKESPKRKKKLSSAFIDLLMINTIIPLKFVYLEHLGTPNNTKILDLISQLKPEKNSVISKFESLTKKPENAMHSQALLYLKKEYCNQQKCLNCGVGNYLLKNY